MITNVIPKLPIRNINATLNYYIEELGFEEIGNYENYLLIKKDDVEIHFFEFKDLEI